MGTAPPGNLYRAISDDAAPCRLEAAMGGGLRYFDNPGRLRASGLA